MVESNPLEIAKPPQKLVCPSIEQRTRGYRGKTNRFDWDESRLREAHTKLAAIDHGFHQLRYALELAKGHRGLAEKSPTKSGATLYRYLKQAGLSPTSPQKYSKITKPREVKQWTLVLFP